MLIVILFIPQVTITYLKKNRYKYTQRNPKKSYGYWHAWHHGPELSATGDSDSGHRVLRNRMSPIYTDSSSIVNWEPHEHKLAWNEDAPSNIPSMFSTFLTSQYSRPVPWNDVAFANMNSVVTTLLVSHVDRLASKDAAEENMPSMYCALLIDQAEISELFIATAPSNVEVK